MDKFIVNGGTKLYGCIDTPVSKNATLPILASCILSSGVIVLHNIPNFSDIEDMLGILQSLGGNIERRNKTITIDCRFINSFIVSDIRTKNIRSSIFLLGPLLGRFKRAVIGYPGGCNIGLRPIDLHIESLRKLNIEVQERFGKLECSSNLVIGNDIYLDYPSVGATENIIMASVLAKGVTHIYNGAREPEVVDLQNFINTMGGRISGAGTDTITIEGVSSLGSTEYEPIRDRIVAGTYLIAGAVCKGDITIKNVEYNHINKIIDKLKESNFDISITNDSIRIISQGKNNSISRIDTNPYPAFPTDLQSQMLVLQSISRGSSIITENLFEGRFKMVAELCKMGADIIVKDKSAFIRGVEKLYGTTLVATDLRAGASLVIAGMVAEGQSTINNVHFIDRGYESLEIELNKLGANIKRLK